MKSVANGTLTAGQATAIAAGSHRISRILAVEWPSTGTVYYSERSDSEIDPDPGKTFVPVIASFPQISRSVGMGLRDTGSFLRTQFSLFIDKDSAASPDVLLETENPTGAIVTAYKVFRTGAGLTDADWLVMARYVVSYYDPIQYGERPIVRFHCTDFSQAKGEAAIGRRIVDADFPSAPTDSLGRMMPQVWGTVEDAPCFISQSEPTTLLDASIDQNDTTIFVVSVAGFDPTGTIVIGNEKITYTFRDDVLDAFGDGDRPCVRGAGGTTPTAHVIGTDITAVLSSYRFLVADHNIANLTNVKINGVALTATDFVDSDPQHNIVTLNGRDYAAVDVNNLPDASAGANTVTTLINLAERRDGRTISSATNASPVVITAIGHDFVAGAVVYTERIEGNLAANSDDTDPVTLWTVANVSGDTFELTGSSGSGAYVRGGNVFRILLEWKAGPSNDPADWENAIDIGPNAHTTLTAVSSGETLGLQQNNDVSTRAGEMKALKVRVEYAAEFAAADGVWPTTSPKINIFNSGQLLVSRDMPEPVDTTGNSDASPSGSPDADTTELFEFADPDMWLTPTAEKVHFDRFIHAGWPIPKTKGAEFSIIADPDPPAFVKRARAQCRIFTNDVIPVPGINVFGIDFHGRVEIDEPSNARGDLVVLDLDFGDPGMAYNQFIGKLMTIFVTGGVTEVVGVSEERIERLSDPEQPLEGSTTPINILSTVQSSRVVQEIDLTPDIRALGGWAAFGGDLAVQVDYPVQDNSTVLNVYNVFLVAEVVESTTGITTAANARMTADVTGYVGKATTLSADINDAVTTIPVVDTSDMDATGTVRIGTEEISYGGKTGTTLTGATREVNSTAKAAHSKDDDVLDIDETTITGEQTLKFLMRHPRYYDLVEDTDWDSTSLASAVAVAVGQLSVGSTWRLDRWLDQELSLLTLLNQAVTDSGIRYAQEGGKWIYFPQIGNASDSQKTLTRSAMLTAPIKNRTRLQLVRNQIEVFFRRSVDLDSDGRFERSREGNHVGSQSLGWGTRRETYDAEWVRNNSVGETLANRMVDDFSTDRQMIQFTGPPTQFDLELGDIITLTDSFSRLTTTRGRVVGLIEPTPDSVRTTVAVSDVRIRVFESPAKTEWLDVFVGGERWIMAVNNVVVGELSRSGLRIKGEITEQAFVPEVARGDIFALDGTTVILSIKDAAGTIKQAMTIDASGDVQVGFVTEDDDYPQATGHTFTTYVEFSDAAGVDLGALSKDVMETTDLSLLWSTIVAVDVAGDANGRLEASEIQEGAL